MIKHKKLNKKLLIIIACIVFIVGAGVFYFISRKSNESSQPSNTSQTETVNLNPPTEADKQQVEDNKQRIVNNEAATSNQTTSGQRQVTPVITYAGQYNDQVEVGSYVSGVFEDSGTCTATFSQGSSTFNRSSTGVRGSNNVNCPMIAVKVADFPNKGAWNVSVSYSSTAAKGTSSSKGFEVK